MKTKMLVASIIAACVGFGLFVPSTTQGQEQQQQSWAFAQELKDNAMAESFKKEVRAALPGPEVQKPQADFLVGLWYGPKPNRKGKVIKAKWEDRGGIPHILVNINAKLRKGEVELALRIVSG